MQAMNRRNFLSLISAGIGRTLASRDLPDLLTQSLA